jgi:hypothetical protein
MIKDIEAKQLTSGDSVGSLVDRTKRQLSLDSQKQNSQGESKLVRIEELINEPEPMEVDDDSQN